MRIWGRGTFIKAKDSRSLVCYSMMTIDTFTIHKLQPAQDAIALGYMRIYMTYNMTRVL